MLCDHSELPSLLEALDCNTEQLDDVPMVGRRHEINTATVA